MTRLGHLRFAIVVGLVLALEGACRAGAIDGRIIIPPSQMLVSMLEQLSTRETLDDLGQTLGNVAVAFVAALVFGLLAGVIIHALPRVRRALDPLYATYYAVPLFIFYPVLIGIFGVSDLPIMLMGFAFAVVAVIICTLDALDRQPRVLTKLAHVHQMGRLASALFIKLPAAAPHLLTGVKLAVAYSFVAVIACEFLLSPSGIGHAISLAYNGFDNRTMYGLILLVIVLVTVVNAALAMWETYLWQRQGLGERGLNVGRAAADGGAISRGIDIVILLAALLSAWYALSLWVGKNALPDPLRTFELIYQLFGRVRFWSNVDATLEAFAISLAITYVAGIVAGVLLAINKLAGETVEPMLVALLSLPKITLLPIILLIFGIGTSSKVAFGALHGIIPITLITMGAIRRLRPIYVKLARSIDLSSMAMVTSIAIPATMPEIASGMRIGFSLTLLGVLIGEMFASKRGLGYMIMNAMGLGDADQTMAVGVFVFVLAGLGNALLLLLDQRLVKKA